MKVALDFGTSYLRIAYLDSEDKIAWISNEKLTGSSALFPSYFEMSSEESKQEYFFFLKSLLEPSSLPSWLHWKGVPYRISLENGKVTLADFSGKTWAYEDLMVSFSENLKKKIESHFDKKVDHLRVAMPLFLKKESEKIFLNYFRKGGFGSVDQMGEPEAAVRGYGEKGRVLLLDFGGGGFSVSLLDFDGEKVARGPVRYDREIAADRVNFMIFDQLLEANKTLREEYVENMLKSSKFFYEIFVALEKIKHTLSHQQSSDIIFPAAGNREPLQLTYSNFQFRRFFQTWAEKVKILCVEVLSEAKTEVEDLDKILLSGGIMRNPMIKQELSDLFNSDPRCVSLYNPIVSLGLATSLRE